MSRINTNVSSLIAQRVPRKNNNALNTSRKRLGTGLKINKAADNPADLIVGEKRRAEKAGIVLPMAQEIIDNAIKQAGRFCGPRGASQRSSTLAVALENASAVETAIRDTDFVDQTANLTRSQILAAATTMLAQGKASPQATLRLSQ